VIIGGAHLWHGPLDQNIGGAQAPRGRFGVPTSPALLFDKCAGRASHQKSHRRRPLLSLPLEHGTNLSSDITTSQTLVTFRKRLKTFLITKSHSAVGLFLPSAFVVAYVF
jgi:hypothetical protein